jgi:inosose dehydratase
MAIDIGNAPCSWGVEFADDPRNPPWRQVLRDCAAAGYRGIELGPVGYMPEDAAILANALAENDLTLIGGVVFRPFHDPASWDTVLDAAERTIRALNHHGAKHLVLIDSISEVRAPTAGRPNEAVQLDAEAWTAFRERIMHVTRLGTDAGLTVSIHPHAAGFMDFEPEIERLLEQTDESLLKICFDTGHHSYAGYDPVEFMRRYIDRISYVHFKDINPRVKADVVANRTGFYDACGQGIFCNLGQGDVNFAEVRKILTTAKFEGWCTVEQDCDPTLDIDPLADAKANRSYLTTIGF